MKPSLLCLGMLVLSGSALAANYYVAPWGDDDNDGLSWATAMKSPELAADRITSDSNTLIISNGTYKLTKPISIYNRVGIRIKSLTGNPKDVVLDGQGQCRGIYLWEGWTGGISGVTVTNCVTTDSSGAGIATRYFYVKITDCIVRDCHIRVESSGSIGGAGIHAMWGTVAGCTVEDCSITNVAGAAGKTVFGAGIYAYRTVVTNCVVRRCAIRLNAGECYPSGAGIQLTDGGEEPNENVSIPTICDTEISACKISLPYASGGVGGGLYVSTSAPDDGAGNPRQAIVRNCLISSCTNWYCGPLTASHADIINTTVTNCVDGYTGVDESRSSGVWLNSRCHVKGCLIAGNVATAVNGHYNGGAPALVLGEDCSVVDSAFVGNSAATRVCLRLADNSLVSNCLFRANVQTTSVACGLVYVRDLAEGAKAEVVDSYFVDNDIRGNWGGWVWFLNQNANRAYDVVFRNCLCANNRLGGGGAVIYSVTKLSKLNAVFENCTVANNTVSGYAAFDGYDEGGTDANPTHVSAYRMHVRGCVVVGNTGSTKGQIYRRIFEATNNVNYTVFSPNAGQAFHPDSVGNKVYDSSKPLFVDAEAKDYRMAANSQACDMVPVSDWMGTGKKNGPQDLGSGFEMVKVGDYGVTINRLNASRRLSGTMADAGCTEYQYPIGMSLLFR